MTDPPPARPPLATYRNARPYPFCPGCGHGPILDHLDRALVKLQRDPARVVIVSDIGCSGLADHYFATSTFHGLHGRSVTYATGIKLARPDLDVVVIMGDGGTGIGGAHLLAAARRNIGVTVLVMNNLNFGMTGGQPSATTPAGAITATTPAGHLERPLDVCATVAVNGASYVYRGTSFDPDLADRIVEALGAGGFSLLDVWEMCTAYFVPQNRLNRKALLALLDEHGLRTGVLACREAPEYARACAEAHAADRGQIPLPPERLDARFTAALDRRFRLVVAGSAGGRVRSAAGLAGRAAILSGLWAAQRDDYPVTVKAGHSVAELILAPEAIHYAGVARPDALLLLTDDGCRQAAPFLARMTPGDRVFTVPPLAGVATRAAVEVLDPGAARPPVGKTDLALAMIAAAVKRLDLFPLAALEEAARRGRAAFAERNLATIRAGAALGSGS